MPVVGLEPTSPCGQRFLSSHLHVRQPSGVFANLLQSWVSVIMPFASVRQCSPQLASKLASSGISAMALLRSPTAVEHAGVSLCAFLTKPEPPQYLLFITNSATVVPSDPLDYREDNTDDAEEPPTL